MNRKQARKARQTRRRRGAAKRPARPRGTARALLLLFLRVSLWWIVNWFDDHS